MQIFKVPQLAWTDPGDMELAFPDDWQVEALYMAGHDRPELSPDAILQAIQNPIGSRPLRELSRGKKEVAIVFDDLSRVTRVAKIVPRVLAELFAAGIREQNIRFICGLGAHGVMSRSDFARKLGEDIVSRFRVYNHNAFGNCVYVGKTRTFQTEVYINEEYMKCDLKIAIGACVPHTSAGFGGGSKLILPGIASIESIASNHGSGGAITHPGDAGKRPTQGMGLIENNRLKQDLDEGAELAGIDFLINVLLNLRGESAAIYAGDWKQAFAAAVGEAKTHYLARRAAGKDIVIANAYAKASEPMIGLLAAVPMVNQQGGDIVLIANAPDGQVTHYLAGLFGKTTGACQHREWQVPAFVNRVIVFTEYPHPGSSCFEENPKISYASRWEDVVRVLGGAHGSGTQVALLPDATNQYFA